MPSDGADYVAVVEAWNEAITQGQNGKPIPIANMYLLAVQKAFSDRIYPHHNKRWAHKIGDPEMCGKDSRDSPTPEERRKMKNDQSRNSSVKT